jgi:hypothetical protein
MTTRFNAKNQSRFNVPGLPTGFDSIGASTMSIPPVGIKDVDIALFKLFDNEIPFQTGGSGIEMKDVPVIFASGEKWAILKRGRALRDRNNSLILPLITIMRTSIEQSPTSDITGRGINQQTGEIVIKRRLDNLDRGYQGLINKLFLQHQTNLAVTSLNGPDAGQIVTSRTIGELSTDRDVQSGYLLIPNKTDNIFETIVLPSPQFFTATYEVVFWSQYTEHMNQMIEMLISSYLPQGNAWQLTTPDGYWFIATVDANSFAADNNSDDMSQEERLIKHKFTIKVPGYILASSTPGAPVPIKRYVSSPTISFDVNVDQNVTDAVDDPNLGADDPTLPLVDDNARPHRSDLRNTNATRLYAGDPKARNPDDPAITLLPRGTVPGQYKKITSTDTHGKVITRYVRIKTTNKFTGETVYASGIDLGGTNT